MASTGKPSGTADNPHSPYSEPTTQSNHLDTDNESSVNLALSGKCNKISIVTPDDPPPKTKKQSSRVGRPQSRLPKRLQGTSEQPQGKTRSSLLEQAFIHHNETGDDNLEPEIFYIEQGDTITAFPTDASYPCTISSEEGKPLFIDTKCFIVFAVDQHINHILITIAIPDEREGYKHQIAARVTIRISAAAIGCSSLRSVDSKTVHGEKIEFDCYSLGIGYSATEISTENIMVTEPLVHVKELADHMKQGLPITLHICGHGDKDGIKSGVKALAEAFKRDSEVAPLTKWLHPKKSVFVVQANEFIPQENRPAHYNLNPKFSFFDWQEFIIIMAIADLEEFEESKEAVTAYETETHDMYIMSILGGGDRIYIGLLDLPNEERVRLQPDDAMLVLDPETEDKETALFGRVTRPLPGIPVSFMTIYLNMKWDKTEERFTQGPFDLVDIINHEKEDRFLSHDKIYKHKPTKVKLSIENDEQAYKNRVAGLALLNRQCLERAWNSPKGQLQTLLLGNNFYRLQPRNIYESISCKVPNPRAVMGSLNDKQQEVYELALKAPAGFVVCHGPPGTGKTFLGEQLIKPFIMARSEKDKDEDKISVLCCSTSNRSVDSLAVRIDRAIRDENSNAPPGSYIVRIHSAQTEIDIAQQDAKAKRAKPQGLRPQLVENLGEEEAETLSSMRLALAIHKTYKSQHERILEHVPDNRVTEESVLLSIGRRILQLIGVVDANKGDPTPGNYPDLLENYRQFANNVEFDAEQAITFRRQLKEAREDVLSNAAVICTTPALASGPKVYTPCQNQVKLIIIDEAARSTEPELLPLFAFYHQADGTILIGDPKQLPPLALASVDKTYFQSQLVLSLQDRLMKGGFPSVMLERQYRMAPDIARPISNLGYGGKLINDASVGFEHRPAVRAVRAFNKEKFGRERCVVYLNVIVSAEGDRDALTFSTKNLGNTGSRYNEAFVIIGINLAKDLMDAFPKASICILTAYNAQYRLYLQAKDNMIAQNPEYARLTIEKNDRAQGMEFDIGIEDLLVGNRAGFLNKAARTNVGGSRWRIGFYLIGSKADIDRARSRNLSKLQSEYLIMGTAYRYNGPFTSQFFTAGDADLLTDEPINYSSIANDDGWGSVGQEAAAIDVATKQDLEGDEQNPEGDEQNPEGDGQDLEEW